MTKPDKASESNLGLSQPTSKTMSNLKSGFTKLKASGSGQSDSTATANTETTNASATGSSQRGNSATKQEDAMELIDGAFTVRKQKWGTYVSYAEDGTELITSLTEELCVSATTWYLKWKQEGDTTGGTRYTGEVGGKL